MKAFVGSCPTSPLFTSRSSHAISSRTTSFTNNWLWRCRRTCAVQRIGQHKEIDTSGVRMAKDSPPLNLPSGVLLLSSSILAIASIGCVFELSGGNPKYGVMATEAILAVSLPGFLFLFYSAIRKGQQEAMEDP